MPVDVLEKGESIKIKLSQIIRMKVKLSFQVFSFWVSQHKLTKATEAGAQCSSLELPLH